MIRLTRSFAWSAKEFRKFQLVNCSTRAAQHYSEGTETKTEVADNSIQNIENSNTPSNESSEDGSTTKTLLNTLINHNNDSSKGYYDDGNRIHRSLETVKLFTNEEYMALCKSLSIPKSVELLKLIASTRNRPTKLLKQISEKVAISPDRLSLIMCSSILYSLSTLSFKDQVLLDKVASDIIKNKKKFTSGILASGMLHSCGVLKYRNCELLDVLIQQIVNLSGQKRTEGLLAGLMTLAVVNYSSPYGTVILNELYNSNSADFKHTKSYVDFIWASVLLNQPSAHHVSNVLSSTFVEQLQVVFDIAGQREMTMRKLLNINAAAMYLIKPYNGSLLENIKCTSISSKSKSQFLMSVVDGLSHIFPKNGYLATNFESDAGFSIDVECAMDSKGNPVLLRRKKDGIKMAIVLVGFNDLCLDEANTESGMLIFQQRILEAKGYKVVKIFHYEYNKLLKLYDKVAYLRKKLESAWKV